MSITWAIIDVATRNVVTVIEVLSPTNKYAGATSRDLYMKKKGEINSSSPHLVEIDLLREGKATFARSLLRPHQYAVHVSPADKRPKGKLCPILLTLKRLPTIEIPLKPRTGRDATLDSCRRCSPSHTSEAVTTSS